MYMYALLNAFKYNLERQNKLDGNIRGKSKVELPVAVLSKKIVSLEYIPGSKNTLGLY